MKEGYSGECAPAFSNKLYPYSVLLSHCNEEVELLKRFYDGVKMTLCCGKQSKHRVTMLKLFSLHKSILIPTEIEHFEW